MRNIWLLGLVSFFCDVSTEMVYPLIPLYLVSSFGATPALVGIIEGIAESLASLLKVFSGYASDKFKRKKPIAFAGYSTAIIYKLALILSTSWVGILTARVIDRIGKGVRTAPRDVLVAENAQAGKLGNAFGLHKALDMAGSALGILLAFFLLKGSKGEFNYKFVFIISIIPSIIGLCILSMVKENKVKRPVKKKENLIAGFKQLDTRLKLFLLVAFVFTLGNSSNTFLLLRAQNVGFDATNVILLYFIYNLVSSIFALPLGKLSDKIGRKKLLVAGYISFSIVYLGFALATNKITIILVFILYGIYTALTAGVERAFIAEVSPKEYKGTMLGLHSTLVGIALLPASIIAGVLWDKVSPATPFIVGSALALIAAVSLSIIMRSYKANQ